MRRMWPWTVKLYWDPWRDIPVIKPRREEIDLLYLLRLSEPGDARPAFRGDLVKLREAIIYEFGSDKMYHRFIEGRFILLNKVPHWDVMYEVVSSGNVIGQLYYDPYSEAWRFRLTFQGAYLGLNEGLVDFVKVKQPIYTGRDLGDAPSTSMRQLVVIDEKNNIRGIALVESGKLIVSKVFHDRSHPVETSGKPASLDDVLKHNMDGLEALEEKSIRYLERLRNRYPSFKAVVSYSGGKDSLVALDLTSRALGSLEIIFNDTGLEMPETLKNVDEVARRYDYKLHVASAGDIFWRAVEVFGPPGKDYRWCCKVAKLVPIAKLTKALWPDGALNVVGQRAYESLDRAKSPLIWRNKWISHMISTTPIQYWSQLAAWLYIFKYKLPYNKLYEEGFDRLGCYLCPSCTLAEFREVSRIYPDLWDRWIQVLERWRERLDQPPEWVKYGLWRWLTPATAKRRIAQHLQNYKIDWRGEYQSRLKSSKAQLVPVEVLKTENELVVKFNENVLVDRLVEVFINNMVALGYSVLSENPLVLKKTGVVEIRGDVIIARYVNDQRVFEDLVQILKTIYRLRACVYCGSCVLWTRREAVKLTKEGPRLQEHLDEKQAKLYIEVCPINDQLVEKIAVSLITDDYKAFKRKTRPRPELT